MSMATTGVDTAPCAICDARLSERTRHIVYGHRLCTDCHEQFHAAIEPVADAIVRVMPRLRHQPSVSPTPAEVISELSARWGPPASSRMTSTIRLTLPVPPSANRWWRNVSGRMVKSREAREYQANVALRCTIARVRKIESPQPVIITLIWYRDRKSGDLDKRLGILLDALQGSLYSNDAQIVKLTAERCDADPAHPRVEIEVAPALVL